MIEQHGSLAEKFLKKGFWLYLFGYIIAPMGYITKIIISGTVTVSDLGILYGVISLITLLTAFSDLGVGESLKYFIPKYLQKKSYDKIKSVLVYSFILQICSGTILGILYFFGADYLALHYFKDPAAGDVLKVFSVFFIGLNVFSILSQFFLAIQNTLYFKLGEFIRSIFILIGILFFSFSGVTEIHTFSFSWILGLYVGIVFATIIFFKNYYTKFLAGEKILWSRGLCKEFFKYSLMVFLSVQAGVILSQIDMQMILYLLDTSQAGYYSVYLSLVMIPFLIIGPIFSLLLPIFSELSSEKSYKKMKTLKSFFIERFSILGIFFGLFLFIFGEQIAFILFSETYIPSGNILKYSVLFLVFNFALQINFNLLGGLGRVRERLYIVLTAIGTNIIMNIIFIKLIGVQGAALATGIGWLLIWLMGEYVLKDFRSAIIGKKAFLINLIPLCILTFISYFLLIQLAEDLSRFQALLYILGAGIIWLGIFISTNYHDFKALFQEVKKLKKGKS